MYGLILLVVALAYILILGWTTFAAHRWARRHGLSRARSLSAAAIGFMAIYLPIFWDQIPTFIRHDYYCRNEAGFWVYESAETWKQKNPSVLGTLNSRKEPKGNFLRDGVRFWTTERFFTERTDDLHFAHAILRQEEILYDAATGEPLARSVNFYRGAHGNVLSGSGSVEKIRRYFVVGLGNRECNSPSPTEQMRMLRGAFRQLGEGKRH